MKNLGNKKLYLIAIVLFALYIANILFGKLSIMVRESNLPISLPDWQAALLLFIAICFFTAGVYVYEEVEN